MKKIILTWFFALLVVSAPAAAQGGLWPVGPGAPSISSAPSVIGQSGVPLIVIGSGSIANNGALTLTTALVSTPAITTSYVYVPAGGIASGVPASATWYYALFSDTTHATIYNNTYSSGTPSIPASPTAFATTGPGAYVGSSAAVPAYQLTIPGSLLGINGGLRVSASFSFTNSGNNKTLTMTYGGTFTFLNATQTTTAAQTGIWGFKNSAKTGAQIVMASVSAALNNATSGNLQDGSIDSTASQTLAINLTNATPASNNLLLHSSTVEFIPGVP